MNLMRCVAIFALSAVALATCGKQRNEAKPPPTTIPAPPDNWRDQIPPEPVPAPQPNAVTFDQFEDDGLRAFGQLSNVEARQTRGVSLCDELNETGRVDQAMVDAVDKALNSISTESRIVRTRGVSVNGCLRLFDKEDFGISDRDWALLEAAEQAEGFGIVSQTQRGQLWQAVAGTRQPWLPAKSLVFAALTKDVYYRVLGAPATLNDWFRWLGLDYQRAWDEADSTLACSLTGLSPITFGKNRSVCVVRAQRGVGGYVSVTYDFLDDNIDATADLNQFPFPFEARNVARSNRISIHDGSEAFGTLPNGMMTFYLADGQGRRVEEAPGDLVAFPQAPGAGLATTIFNAVSCMNCHAGGYLSSQDTITDNLLSRGDLLASERQVLEVIFGGGGRGFNSQIQIANDEFHGALRQLGIDPSTADPVTTLTHKFRSNWSLEQIAALYFLSAEEFARRLNGSPQGRVVLGQVLQGGRIPLDTLRQINPVIQRDLNLFQDGLRD